MRPGGATLIKPYAPGSGVMKTTVLRDVLASLEAIPNQVTVYSLASYGSAGQVSTTYALNSIAVNQLNLGAVTAGTDQAYVVGDLLHFGVSGSGFGGGSLDAATLLGNPFGSSASASEITLGAGLAFLGTVLVLTGGGYASPAFTAFGITGITSPVEVGATIGGESETFTWSTSNSANVVADSISITDTTASAVLASGLANTGSHAITIDSITNTGPASQVWTIEAENTLDADFSRTFTVLWEWRVYAGSSANATLTANQIKALDDSDALQSAFAGDYSITNGSTVYYYFCYPDSMGSVNGFVDGGTGFPISMATSADNAAYSNTANGWSYAIVSVTNVNSITTNYRVYRTQYSFSASPLKMNVS